MVLLPSMTGGRESYAWSSRRIGPARSLRVPALCAFRDWRGPHVLDAHAEPPEELDVTGASGAPTAKSCCAVGAKFSLAVLLPVWTSSA
jgi:hypothetical protein